MLSWSKGSPRVKVRVKVAAVFNTGSKVFVLLGCKLARKHSRVLCSQPSAGGKRSQRHINVHVDLESNLCPLGQPRDSKVPSPLAWPGLPSCRNLVGMTGVPRP